jgi:DNA-binding transcriptional LysR family regulator
MPRHINLRQVEAFKALMESGTVSRAAEMLHITQSGMSKLIAHLEFDTGLKLFDRVKGRLAPTEHAMRFHDEVERIFTGVRQLEGALEAIRRDELGRIAIGVMPTLSGNFIQRATTSFLKNHDNVFCSVESLGSNWIVDRLISRKLDVGLVSARINNPYVTLEPLMEHPLVCIMPLDHPLTNKRVITPPDLAETPFVTFKPDTFAGNHVEAMLKTSGIKPKTLLVSNIGPTISEFVAAGLGVSLVHPLMMSGLENHLAVRPFKPAVLFSFQLCHIPESRNAQLVKAFLKEVRAVAEAASTTMREND